MKIIDGDIIQLAKAGEINVLIHGCNCKGVMGAGLAGQIRHHFPAAYKADLEHYEMFSADTRLGDYSVADCSFYDMSKPLKGINQYEIHKLFIVNAYTQYNPGRNTDYDALTSALQSIYLHFANKGYKFGLPQIGCGIGGGDWNIVSKIIKDTFHDEDVTIVMYNPKPKQVDDSWMKPLLTFF